MAKDMKNMQRRVIYQTSSKENSIIQKRALPNYMKQELSAGAIICKKVKSVWNVLLIRDMKGLLTFPKGLMEPGEDKKQTAIREAAEETGIIDLQYVTELPDVSYFYTRNGKSIKKLVHYFLFLSTNDLPLTPQREEGITELIWMSMEKAISCIGYGKSNTPVLIAASTYITKHLEKPNL